MNLAVVCLTVICVAQAGIAVAMLCLHRAALRDWTAERRDLLLRIQAPQVAVAMDYNRGADENPPAIDMSDGPMGDESYWMSREQLAEAEAQKESSARGN